MTESADHKSALARLLERGVYAPLGYLLTRSKTRPELIAAGRKQVAFSRSLGRAALQSMARGRGAPPQLKGPQLRGPQLKSPQLKSPQLEPAGPAPVAVESAAIDGYPDMTAKQLIAFISSATSEQLAWIIEHESAHKQRVTVLRAATKQLDPSSE